MNSGIVVWPLDTHLAALTVAYSIIKCASLFAALCWHGSILTEGQISAEPKYAAIDWQCWLRYGSWSQCPHCGSLMYNDQYFRDNIYQTRATTGKPCPMSVHGGASPSEPLVHAHGHVGVSSRWWYLSAMYKPVAVCVVIEFGQLQLCPTVHLESSFFFKPLVFPRKVISRQI